MRWRSCSAARVEELLSADPCRGGVGRRRLRWSGRRSGTVTSWPRSMRSCSPPWPRKSLTGEIGTTSAADVLVTECRVTAVRGESLGCERLVIWGRGGRWSGEATGPDLPGGRGRVGCRFSINAAQARVIREALPRIPADKAGVASPIVERHLVDVARHLDARALRVEAEKILAALDPDGREPDEERSHRRRHVTMSPCPGRRGRRKLPPRRDHRRDAGDRLRRPRGGPATGQGPQRRQWSSLMTRTRGSAAPRRAARGPGAGVALGHAARDRRHPDHDPGHGPPRRTCSRTVKTDFLAGAGLSSGFGPGTRTAEHDEVAGHHLRGQWWWGGAAPAWRADVGADADAPGLRGHHRPGPARRPGRGDGLWPRPAHRQRRAAVRVDRPGRRVLFPRL